MKQPVRSLIKAPQSGLRLLAFFGGSQYADAIFGDFEEMLSSRPHPYIWFWIQVFRSLPSLFLMQISNLPRHVWLLHGGIILASFGLICSWEILVARHISWPIAKELLYFSPLDAGNTCRTVYVLVYSFFVFSLMQILLGIAKSCEKTQHFRDWQVFIFSSAASLPALFLTIFPLPTDGALWFRIAQLALIWTLAIGLIFSKKAQI